MQAYINKNTAPKTPTKTHASMHNISFLCCMPEQDCFLQKPFQKTHTTTQNTQLIVSINNNKVYMCRYELNFCLVPSYTTRVKVILFTVLLKGTVVHVVNYCDMKTYGELRCNSTYSQASCSGCFSLGERKTGTLWGARSNFPTYHGLYVVTMVLRRVKVVSV